MDSSAIEDGQVVTDAARVAEDDYELEAQTEEKEKSINKLQAEFDALEDRIASDQLDSAIAQAETVLTNCGDFVKKTTEMLVQLVKEKAVIIGQPSLAPNGGGGDEPNSQN